MTAPDALVERLAAANPVPDVSAFRPTEAEARDFVAALTAPIADSPTARLRGVGEPTRFEPAPRAEAGPRPRLLIGLVSTAAAVSLCLAGLWWLRGEPDSSPDVADVADDTGRDDAADTSGSEPSPAASTLPDGDRVESADPSIQVANDVARVDFDDVAAVTGQFSWTLVEADSDSLPELWSWPATAGGIEIDPNGGYVAYDWPGSGTRRWHSDDAVTWNYEFVDDGPSSPWDTGGDWALGDGELELVRTGDGEAQLVPLERPATPDIDGLDLHVTNALPRRLSGELEIVEGTVWATPPWDDIYGTSVLCDPQCHETSPFVPFGIGPDGGEPSADGPAWVIDPATGETLAVLDVEIGETSIVFRDQETGDVVHEITARTADDLRPVVASLADLPDLAAFQIDTVLWVGSSERGFDLVDSPPGDTSGLISLPDGGVGNFSALEQLQPDGAFGDVYVSADGLDWVTVAPGFIEGRDITGALVSNDGDRIAATVMYRRGGWERWTSTDGVDWTFEFQFPAKTVLHRTGWGWAAFESATGWVSIDDGRTWARLPTAPVIPGLEFNMNTSSGFGRVDDADHELFWRRIDMQEEADGRAPRYLLLGRFETPSAGAAGD